MKEKTVRIKTLKKKTGQLAERIQPIPIPFFDTFKTYLKLDGREYGLLFKLSRQRVWQLVKLYGEKSGIKKSIHPHTLRHSFATHVYEKREDIKKNHNTALIIEDVVKRLWGIGTMEEDKLHL